MAGRTRTARLFVRVSPAPAHSQHDNRPFVNRRVLLLLLAFTVVPTNKRESRNLGRPLRVLISFPLLSLLRILSSIIFRKEGGGRGEGEVFYGSLSQGTIGNNYFCNNERAICNSAIEQWTLR